MSDFCGDRPSKSENEHALRRLQEIEKQFQDAVAFHDQESRVGGVRLVAASRNLAQASKSYRHALLDPCLPPI
jgi:hypothetical protein